MLHTVIGVKAEYQVDQLLPAKGHYLGLTSCLHGLALGYAETRSDRLNGTFEVVIVLVTLPP